MNDAEIEAAPVLDSATAATAQPDSATLPAAGDARREELKRRYDALLAEAEILGKDLDFGTIDPAKLDKGMVENEIAQHFDPSSKMLEVQGARADRAYKWEQADIYNRWGNVWVTMAKSLGWKMVSGDMPEARNHRQVDGMRRVGDAVLMWIERERFDAIEADDRRRRISRKEGISLHILEEADRLGVKVHDLGDGSAPAHIMQMAQAQRAAGEAARSTMVANMRQAGRNSRNLASSLADRKLEQAIRDGKVPGLTV